MNLGIFGHSIAKWESKDPQSYVAKLRDHFDANLVNIGVSMCSEERILFQLKKIKKMDLAIIFHCDPTNCFIPSWYRDATTLDRDLLEKKFNLIKDSRLNEIIQQVELMEEYIEKMAKFRNIPNSEDHVLSFMKQLQEIDNMPVMSVLTDIARKKDQNIELFDLQQTMSNESKEKVIDDLLQNTDIFFKELVDALTLHKRYLYHPDLQLNRYYGALSQIDQFLNYKQIPVVHCLGRESWYPPWFKFTSGVFDTELSKFQRNEYFDRTSENAVSPEGNNIMFETLLDLISAARSKEVIH